MIEYPTVKRKKMLIMGISIRTTNEGGQAEKDISQLWDRFYSESIVEDIPNKAHPDILGVYTDYEKDHTGFYTLLIGCEVKSDENIPPGLEVKEIPAAEYAVLRAEGPFPESIIQTWNEVWESDLNRSYIADMEIYGEPFHQDPPVVQLLIGVI